MPADKPEDTSEKRQDNGGAAHPVDQYIRSLVKCARALPQKDWRWGQFTRPNGEPIETVDHVCEAQENSARQSERAELWGVDLGVDAPVVCYTGNGPCSKDHAQYIAALHPRVLIWVLDELGDRIERRGAANRDLLEACKAALVTHGLTKSEPGLPTLAEVEKLLRSAIQRAGSEQ